MNQMKSKAIRVFVMEEQEVYREAYKAAFSLTASIELLGVSPIEEVNDIGLIISTLNPEVLVVGMKKLQKDVIMELGKIRHDKPQIGITILAMSYGVEDIDLLHKTVAMGNGGIAILSKQSLDQIEQLCRVIISVHQGQIVFDGLSMSVVAGKPSNGFLRELTARETEILSLLSSGYSNTAIAQSLYIDIHTVKHHINSLYSKLKAESDLNGRHPRVCAARLYLQEN